MNKFVLEPTDENLERHKRVQNTEIYWHSSWFENVLILSGMSHEDMKKIAINI